MEELETWLTTIATAPPMVKAITSNFNAWRGGRRHPATRSRLPGLSVAIQKQHRLGWTAAFEGRWATEFVAIQDRYFRFMNMRRTGKRWLVSVIKKLWDIAWSLWQHRNRIQERVREAKLREKLKAQAVETFNTGSYGLHPASRRLFTHKTIDWHSRQLICRHGYSVFRRRNYALLMIPLVWQQTRLPVQSVPVGRHDDGNGFLCDKQQFGRTNGRPTYCHNG